MPHSPSFYNKKEDSVDTIISDYVILRLRVQEIFATVTATPKTHALIVKLAKENPVLFTEMVLDRQLQSYLESLS